MHLGVDDFESEPLCTEEQMKHNTVQTFKYLKSSREEAHKQINKQTNKQTDKT